MQQSHIHGFFPKFLADNAPDQSEEKFRDSFVPPSSFWTGQEKQRFFVALKRYSRLQPELIQQEIGDSKQVWEVCGYINYLDQAAATVNGASTSTSFGTLEHAREMSKQWIRSEEKWAAERNEREYDLLTSFYEQQQESTPPDEQGSWTTREALRELNLPILMAMDNMLRDNQIPTDIDQETEDAGTGAETEVDVSAMSWQERRRYQKRIHMRKKRAEARGEHYDDTPALKKIGRKKDPVHRRKHSQRGFVLLEKGKDFFIQAGITKEELLKEELDIFNHSVFGKIAGLTSEMSGGARFGNSICGELLILLRAHLCYFIQEVINRVLSFMEHERVRTDHTKIFKGSRDKIRAEHVRHVAQTMIGEGDHLGWLLQFESRVRAAMKATGLEEDEEASMSDKSTTSSESDSTSDSESETSSSSDPSSPPKPNSTSNEPISKTRANKHHKPLVSTFLSQLHPPLLWVPHSLSHSIDRFEPSLLASEPWTSDFEREFKGQLEEEEEIENAQMVLDKNDEKDIWARVREEYAQEEARRALLPVYLRPAQPAVEGEEPVKRKVGRPKGSETKKRKRAVADLEGEADDEADEEEGVGLDSDDHADEPMTKKRKLGGSTMKGKQKNRLPEPAVDKRFREKGGKIKSTVYIDSDADASS